MGKSPTIKLTNTYFWSFLIFWTFLISGSLYISITNYKDSIFELALARAEGNFHKDQAFRHWATQKGGVYVPVTENTPPSPYLAHVPYRDIPHPDGRQLTLMNPAYILRQLHTDFAYLSGTIEHITSLKLLRPENKPDKWEVKALKSFEHGKTSMSELSEINGKMYLRHMQPMVTAQG